MSSPLSQKVQPTGAKAPGSPQQPPRPSGAEGLAAHTQSTIESAVETGETSSACGGFWLAIGNFFAAIFYWFISLFTGGSSEAPSKEDKPENNPLDPPPAFSAVAVEQTAQQNDGAATTSEQPKEPPLRQLSVEIPPSKDDDLVMDTEPVFHDSPKAAPTTVQQLSGTQPAFDSLSVGGAGGEAKMMTGAAGVGSSPATSITPKEFIDKWMKWASSKEPATARTAPDFYADFLKLPENLQLRIKERLSITYAHELTTGQGNKTPRGSAGLRFVDQLLRGVPEIGLLEEISKFLFG
jgi:hypothetical protein